MEHYQNPHHKPIHYLSVIACEWLHQGCAERSAVNPSPNGHSFRRSPLQGAYPPVSTLSNSSNFVCRYHRSHRIYAIPSHLGRGARATPGLMAAAQHVHKDKVHDYLDRLLDWGVWFDFLCMRACAIYLQHDILVLADDGALTIPHLYPAAQGVTIDDLPGADAFAFYSLHNEYGNDDNVQVTLGDFSSGIIYLPHTWRDDNTIILHLSATRNAQHYTPYPLIR